MKEIERKTFDPQKSSKVHGILSMFTSNHPLDNQLFVENNWLDLAIRSLFRLSVPMYMLYKWLRPDPQPDIELQVLHRD